MRNLKRLILIVLGILCMGGCGKMSQGNAAFIDKNVVFVQSGSLRGSGVLYQLEEDRAVIVTAAHVVSDDQKVTVQHKKADKIHFVDGLDLVFLVLDKVDASLEVDSVVNDDHDEKTKADDKLSLKGYDASGTWREISGIQTQDWIYVEDFGCHMMIGKADAVQGMSGGGVFDQTGTFLGIICGMDQEGNVAILPASVIASEYEVLFGALNEK